MDENSAYYRQVRLLVQLLPFINQEACFALKGGTAINLFVRDMPRLSVDIDLVYLPAGDRQQALGEIHAALDRIASRIAAGMRDVTLLKAYQAKPDALRLTVNSDNAQVKIELSPVLRGVVNGCERRAVVESVEREFGYAEMAVVSLEDLYAGKICAALDRQHPRDLFDVHLLLEHEGLTEAMRKTLLVYLLSHARPLEELLQPRAMDISAAFFAEFQGMAFIDITREQLLNSRERLVSLVNQSLTEADKRFLVSFHQQQPAWERLDMANAAQLPAIQWKLQNLGKMGVEKHASMMKRLERALAGK